MPDPALVNPTHQVLNDHEERQGQNIHKKQQRTVKAKKEGFFRTACREPRSECVGGTVHPAGRGIPRNVGYSHNARQLLFDLNCSCWKAQGCRALDKHAHRTGLMTSSQTRNNAIRHALPAQSEVPAMSSLSLYVCSAPFMRMYRQIGDDCTSSSIIAPQKSRCVLHFEGRSLKPLGTLQSSSRE